MYEMKNHPKIVYMKKADKSVFQLISLTNFSIKHLKMIVGNVHQFNDSLIKNGYNLILSLHQIFHL